MGGGGDWSGSSRRRAVEVGARADAAPPRRGAVLRCPAAAAPGGGRRAGAVLELGRGVAACCDGGGPTWARSGPLAGHGDAGALERCWRGGAAGRWSAGGARVRVGPIWVFGPDLGPIWTYGFGAGNVLERLFPGAGRWWPLQAAGSASLVLLHTSTGIVVEGRAAM
jgi:hypothetical protein